MLLGMGKVYIHMAFSNHMAPSWERKMIGGDSVGKNNPSWTRELKTGASDLWSTATPFVFDTYQELQMREQNGQLALGLNPHSRERERARGEKAMRQRGTMGPEGGCLSRSSRVSSHSRAAPTCRERLIQEAANRSSRLSTQAAPM